MLRYMASRRAVPPLPKYRWLEKNTKTGGALRPRLRDRLGGLEFGHLDRGAAAADAGGCRHGGFVSLPGLAGDFGISENGALGRGTQRVGLQRHFGREASSPGNRGTCAC